MDGITPVNAGLLFAGRPFLAPCTPLGVMKLLAAADVSPAGARALVIGRSSLVGRPAAALLTAADATVTLAHSRTRDLAAECRRAEILVVAAGKPELVRGDWIGTEAVVIDVGIHRLPGGLPGARPGGALVGDVAFAEALSVASAHHAGPGRGRADDDRLPAREHAHGGARPPGLKQLAFAQAHASRFNLCFLA